MSAAFDKADTVPSTSVLPSTVWRHGLYAAGTWVLAAIVTVALPDVVPWGSRDLFAALLVAVAALFVAFAFVADRLGRFGGWLVHYGPWFVALGVWFALWELVTAKLGWMPKPFFSPPHGL